MLCSRLLLRICDLTPTGDNVAAGGSSSSNSSSRFSSENITFRLRKDQLNQLRQEAKIKRISLNTLANQIVDSHVSYNSNLSSANIIPVSKPILVALVETCSEDELKAIADQVQKKITMSLKSCRSCYAGQELLLPQPCLPNCAARALRDLRLRVRRRQVR
jgi:hypothetical protein